MESKFDLFKKRWTADIDLVRDELRSKGVYDFTRIIEKLCKAQNKMCQGHLIELFDKQLGEHIWDKFIRADRNILRWLNEVSEEYRFFILLCIHEGDWL